MRATLLLICLLLCKALPAQQFPGTDTIAQRYAAIDTVNGQRHAAAAYFLVKFCAFPGNKVQDYGVVKTLSPLHYILQRSVQRDIIYCYPANDNWKATEQLLQQVDHTPGQDSITLQVVTAGTPAYCRIKRNAPAGVAVAVVKKDDWPAFISQPAVRFAESIRRPVTEIIINSADPSANQVNTAQQQYPLLRGNRITVSVKENLFDTGDIDLARRYLPSGLSSAQTTSHATIMATMIAGAGNSGAKGLGAAPQTKLSSVDFSSLLPEADNYFRQYDITVQNHSYGTGIENYYGAEAMAYDQQVFTADTLLHVFSSGNVGDQSPAAGVYQRLPAFANLSGAFKQAKNVLVTGGTGDSLQVSTLSSRGPAYDGRIKPEITAFGVDGTSGAAAVTSGVAALLQDAFREQYGRAPSAALVKALLVNSARKVNKAPLNYSGGFGSLDALAALHTLYARHFLSGTVSAGTTQRFTVTVPPEMRELRVTLCWNDPPAAVNAASALVNDLDLELADANAQHYLPWVLSAYPAMDSLLLPARRGRDSLNNIEQVTLEHPPAGALQLAVHGRRVGAGPQSFHLAYEWIPSDHFQWQNPADHEVINAGAMVPLRWDSNLEGSGHISYSLDSGNSWQTIAQQIPFSAGLYYWQVPDTFAAAQLRYSNADTAFTSSVFFISPRLALQTGYDCTDSAFIYWPQQRNAAAYQLYRLEGPYLAPYIQTRDTFLAVPAASGSPWFSVSPVHTGGWTGLKSYALNYKAQGTGCYFQSLLADVTADNNVLLSLSLGSTFHVQQLQWQRQSKDTFITLAVTPVGTDRSFTYQDNAAQEGLSYYRARLDMADGRSLYTDPVPVYLLRNHSFLLFPNPVHNTLQVLSKTLGNLQLQLYDMSGKLLAQQRITNLLETLPVAHLPAGVYNCSIYDNGKKVFSKLVVKQ